MRAILKAIVLAAICSCWFISVAAQARAKDRHEKKLRKSMVDWQFPLQKWAHVGNIQLDSFKVNHSEKEVAFYFNKALSHLPWRHEAEAIFKNSLTAELKGKIKGYQVGVYTGGYELVELIPNIYSQDVDRSRLPAKIDKAKYIYKVGAENFAKGLANNYVALYHSHGWYYESKLDRWEWQRARLYGSVEDISPMIYVLQYIAPMLENSGATVFMPRERCFQRNEIIVDDDWSSGSSELIVAEGLRIKRERGFAYKDTLFSGDNPFTGGRSQTVINANGKVAEYLPEIPEDGEYAVYVSYRQSPSNSEEVKYTIKHSGGSTSYVLNQTMGGGTWAYLGTFCFKKGKGSSVEVYGNGQVSLDAVRIGGGMGNVARRPADEVIPNKWSLRSEGGDEVEGEKVNPNSFTWKTSQRPRYTEASRYWLQYAGMPDTLIYSLNEDKNDYNDDYQSRGEWVNYLMGAPNGPAKNRDAAGLSLPVDLALAFHTDAGVTPDDSVIGTLGIYSSERDERVFLSGQSKLASRDLTDIVQTQIVEDIRVLYNEKWRHRGIWDRQYSEAWRPNVPTMLLELLSHQNLADMRYGLDPHFRFNVSRAVYKGILKFLAFQEGRDYVVHPLPVSHLAITESTDGYKLSWQAVADSLEPTAIPTKYRVYRRVGSSGFDNGTIVEDTSCILPKADKGQIVSYKVTALNDGGESMPSEVLSMGIAGEQAEKVLVVNAFDRISAPSFIDEGNFAGVAWWDDHGVPDKFEYAYTGHQYDFNRQSPWLDDDSPGWGASHGDSESKVIKGNSFDNVMVHGESIMRAGYSFVSVSDEVFESKSYDASVYKAIDVILGEEKTTVSHEGGEPRYIVYTPAFMDKIKQVTANGQHIFMSGAYIASDFILQNDTIAEAFVSEVLHFYWRTNHAAKGGSVYTTDYAIPIIRGEYTFNTDYHPDFYTVEAPDAIEPLGKDAITAFRYKENNASAGTIYNGEYKNVMLGFPFETIIKESERDALMKDILDFFIKAE